MSEVNAIIVPMSTLGHEITIAREALRLAEDFENASGYDIEATMDRKYNEGFLEALEFIYILQNGHEYSEWDC